MKHDEYQPTVIEPMWAEKWQKEEVFRATDNSGKPKMYLLVEFPYPSGERLHVGHARSYSCIDALARKKRMQGLNVMFPMGWDAFGLPAENYAIKTGIHPSITTTNNIANAKKQAISWGLSFDWDREVNTSDPGYYKWTQWIFIQLFKKGLAYKEEIAVNWCPSCKINLANEEVIDGKCERCGAETERRKQSQWLLAITKYADRLAEDLKTVNFREDIAAQQVNWIGKKEGININYPIEGREENVEVFTTRPDTNFGATFIVLAPEHPIANLAAEMNPEVKQYIEKSLNKSERERQVEGKQKTGVFTGWYAVNQLNNYKMPIWVSDFVLMGFGTGAVVGVPGHDARDFEFAIEFGLPIIPVVKVKPEKFRSYLMGADNITDEKLGAIGVIVAGKSESGSRKLEIAPERIVEYEKLISEKLNPGFWNEYIGDEVVFIFKDKKGKVERIVLDLESEDRINELATQLNGDNWTKIPSVWGWLGENEWYRPLIVQEEEGIMINSDFLNGLDIHVATEKIMDYLEEKGWGKRVATYHLRDWVFSRQHYWGEPIPMIYCEKCAVEGKSWVTENKDESLRDPSTRSDELARDDPFGKLRVGNESRVAGWWPVPEEQLPVKLPEVEKYLPTETGESPLAHIDSFVITTCPNCGSEARRETDTMPNWAGSSWYYLRYCDPRNNRAIGDPAKLKYWLPVDWYNGGMEHTTLHLLYSRFWHKFLFDLGVVPTPEPYAKRTSHGMVLGPNGLKMSKSRGNVINPDDIVGKFGADTLRMYEMFIGPFDQAVAWSDESMEGVYKFLKRVWRIVNSSIGSHQVSSNEAKYRINQLIELVDKDLESGKFNTVVSSMMEFLNWWQDNNSAVGAEIVEAYVKLLAPSAPFIAEELYQRLTDWSDKSSFKSVHLSSWPEVFGGENDLDRKVTVVVQINGKVRERLEIAANIALDEGKVKEAAEARPKIMALLGEAKYRYIFVPGKLINFVV